MKTSLTLIFKLLRSTLGAQPNRKGCRLSQWVNCTNTLLSGQRTFGAIESSMMLKMTLMRQGPTMQHLMLSETIWMPLIPEILLVASSISKITTYWTNNRTNSPLDQCKMTHCLTNWSNRHTVKRFSIRSYLTLAKSRIETRSKRCKTWSMTWTWGWMTSTWASFQTARTREVTETTTNPQRDQLVCLLKTTWATQGGTEFSERPLRSNSPRRRSRITLFTKCTSSTPDSTSEGGLGLMSYKKSKKWT